MKTMYPLIQQYEDLHKYGADVREQYRRWSKWINGVNRYAAENNLEVGDVLLAIEDYFEGR